MNWLEHGQQAVMQALDHGPDHVPQLMFTGPPERVLAGLNVHANTISHARLVALEDTFPRTRCLIGHGQFNALSRRYIERADAAAHPLAQIGAGFPAFLAESEISGAASLAAFEWQWLAAYHAADAPPLELSALAGATPAALLEMAASAHPAAHLVPLHPAAAAVLADEVPGLADADAALITRPAAQVLIMPAAPAMTPMLEALRRGATIGNLLAPAVEQAKESDSGVGAAMQVLVALIEAGAVVRG